MKPALLGGVALETVRRCVVCASDAATADPVFATRLGLVEPFGVARCCRCGLRWLSPRPTAAGYALLYTNENYFGGRGSVEDFAVLARAREPHFERRVRRIERLFSGKPRLRILDVGAATGLFVHVARRRGHWGEGVELSSDARITAREKYGIDLLPGSLSEVPTDTLFDVVHLNHVLEHLPDPCGALDRCRELLKPAGYLVLEVPRQFDNDLDRLKRLLKLARNPTFNAYSLHHTYFYNPSALAQLVRDHGFGVTSLQTASPGYTPLWPPTLRMAFLRPLLWLCDRVHQGGNIIEVYARAR